jgi:hypothetical protein
MQAKIIQESLAGGFHTNKLISKITPSEKICLGQFKDILIINQNKIK